jgi:hypothetical protein
VPEEALSEAVADLIAERLSEFQPEEPPTTSAKETTTKTRASPQPLTKTARHWSRSN